MSKSYQIAVSASLRRHIVVADGVCAGLELLDILPKAEMAALLEVQLVALGFEREDAVLRRTDDNIVTEIDPVEATVKVSLTDQDTFEAEREFTGRAWEENAAKRRAAIEKSGQAALAAEADAAEAQLQAKITGRLEDHLRDLRTELDRAVNRTTAEALKRRAGQLGEITEIQEDETSGDLTIRVRL